jgi:hypothetical protein
VAERVRVVRRGFIYPADAASVDLVQAAGGVSKLSPEDRDRIVWKNVGPGDFCDDMPASALALYLERGDLERVTVADEEPAPVAKPRRAKTGGA